MVGDVEEKQASAEWEVRDRLGTAEVILDAGRCAWRQSGSSRMGFIRMTHLQRYDGRRVLITGGGSGIGQASVLRILDEGGSVVAADNSEEGLRDTTARPCFISLGYGATD